MYNLTSNLSIEEIYEQGWLPQRNQAGYFYTDDNCSCRSRLQDSQLSSENRRILKKTDRFSYKLLPLKDFNYTPALQKQLSTWTKTLNWNFPASSIKTVFTNHIFNFVYLWTDNQQPDHICAYTLCFFYENIVHVAYVFYDPIYTHSDLPIRLPLQVFIDAQEKQLKYCYFGRFNPETKLGFYKRNFPNFEYFVKGKWISYN